MVSHFQPKQNSACLQVAFPASICKKQMVMVLEMVLEMVALISENSLVYIAP